MLSLPATLKTLLMLAKTLEKQKLNFSRSALLHMKTGVNLKYFVAGCSYALCWHTEIVLCYQKTSHYLVWSYITSQ